MTLSQILYQSVDSAHIYHNNNEGKDLTPTRQTTNLKSKPIEIHSGIIILDKY